MKGSKEKILRDGAMICLYLSVKECNVKRRFRQHRYRNAQQRHNMHHTDDLKFISFTPPLAKHFKAINEQWISEMFQMEALDTDILQYPQQRVIEPGGHIWFAQHASLGVIGTCAIVKKAEGVFELTKMGVLQQARGLKAGERLLRHVLAESEKMSIKCLFLLTNIKCAAAIHLYEKNGFTHDTNIMTQYGSAYKRCNVAMQHLSLPFHKPSE
jgi:N-acetylglutamate synthase-like GNAT family acetyltransferase